MAELTRLPYISAFTPKNIIPGFQFTGIKPFDRFAISDDRFAPLPVTDRDAIGDYNWMTLTTKIPNMLTDIMSRPKNLWPTRKSFYFILATEVVQDTSQSLNLILSKRLTCHSWNVVRFLEKTRIFWFSLGIESWNWSAHQLLLLGNQIVRFPLPKNWNC